jgi:ubiquitin-activating enzyme E1
MAAQNIDEDLYSRQMYVYGREAMGSMSKANILISGMNGLGAEIAKNVILSGVKSVCMHDTKNVTMNDLSSHFYLDESMIGKNRTTVARDTFAELNAYVSVVTNTEPLTKEFLSKYSVLVTTDVPVSTQVKLNNLCRSLGVKYIHAETRGVFGKVFCDFGEGFVVVDTDGEQPVNVHVATIVYGDDYVDVVCTEPHELSSGMHVKFIEIEGPDVFNSLEHVTIKVIKRDVFRFEYKDVSSLPKFVRGGTVLGVKLPVTYNFKTLETSISEPDFMISDFLNMHRPSVLHSSFSALGNYEETYGRLPVSHHKEHVDAFVNEALKLYGDDFPEEERKTLETFANNARGELVAMNSVIGGIAAQEVLKASSGKFTPIRQFLYLDSMDSLSHEDMPEEDYVTEGNRYDGQVTVFGKTFQQKIQGGKTFIVGSGAIGCELLKNYAMTGLSSGDGCIYVTDMDTIEKSNLNRQFLFRPTDIGKSKSKTAKEAVQKMNSSVNILAHENKVGQETEYIYSEDFFKQLNFVTNALDNVAARKFVDSLCVLYQKPLLESGTLGTKGNTQVIVPFLTESYGSRPDPPERSIPLCTLKNFPSSINHTIQWARDRFEGSFVNSVNNSIRYLKDPKEVSKLPPTEFGQIYDDVMFVLDKWLPKNYGDCLRFARYMFEHEYVNQIKQLLNQFPADHTTGEGAPFWTGTKRCPTVNEFDVDNQDHMEYILSCAKLWADVFNIKTYTTNVKQIEAVLTDMESKLEKFVPDNSTKIHVDDKEEENEQQRQLSVERDPSDLPDPDKFKSLQLTALDFEKDDPTNGHIDFVTIASNLRATNYKIDHADKHKTKGIAGKIIPAIATTTAIVAGLVTLEMYKLLHKHDKLENYRNAFMNLAVPFIAFAEPGITTKFKVGTREFTMWDSLEIKGDCTVKELIKKLTNSLGYDVDMIVYGDKILDSFAHAPNFRAKRQKRLVSDLIKELTGEEIKTKMVKLFVELDFDDEDDGDNMEAPEIKFYF